MIAFIFEKFLIFNFLDRNILKVLFLYSFFTTASALNSGPLFAAKILLAVVYPEDKEPVIAIFFILILTIIIQLNFDQFQDSLYSINRKLFDLGK